MKQNERECFSELESFSSWLEKHNKTENTIKTYKGVLHSFYKWMLLKNEYIDELSKEHLQAYIHHLEVEGKSASTIGKTLAAFSLFAHFIEKPSLVHGIEVRSSSNHKETMPEHLDHEEREKLLASVKKDGNLRDIAIVYILLHTGIRVSELCHLDRGDVIQDEIGSGLIVRGQKGEIKRTIPLSKEAGEHVNRYLSRIIRHQEALFLSNIGQRMTTRAVQYMLKKYDVNPHKLRHTFCYELVHKGVDLATVAQLAGHSDINVTKRYASLASANLKEAINRVFA
ncbi:tyrosine-type recombinase/integrase [Bacillus songklensis]|uniref:Tyrosine-type recombinase/integrase n=1 Tax=Bacillus songklensis TaxID=1069116 RepID=A0ABV8B9H8_9BACI